MTLQLWRQISFDSNLVTSKFINSSIYFVINLLASRLGSSPPPATLSIFINGFSGWKNKNLKEPFLLMRRKGKVTMSRSRSSVQKCLARVYKSIINFLYYMQNIPFYYITQLVHNLVLRVASLFVLRNNYIIILLNRYLV